MFSLFKFSIWQIIWFENSNNTPSKIYQIFCIYRIKNLYIKHFENIPNFSNLVYIYTGWRHCLILAGTIIALRRWLRNSEWEVIMRTCPISRNVRHRAMTTPVCPLRIRLIHVSPSDWTNLLLWRVCTSCWSKPNTKGWFGPQNVAKERLSVNYNFR